MKKFIYFFICVMFIVMVSCKQAAGVGGGNADMKNNNSLLLEKEKKTQAQEKEYKNGHWWTVAIKSRLNDPRPDEEALMGPPEGYDIINTVLYTSNDFVKVQDFLYFIPNFEIQKTVKYGSNEISFILTIRMTTLKTNLSHYTTLPAQLQLPNNQILNYNCQVSYENEEEDAVGEKIHTVTCKINISLDNVNQLRLQKEDIVVIVKVSDKEFKFKLPHKFIEFLREI